MVAGFTNLVLAATLAGTAAPSAAPLPSGARLRVTVASTAEAAGRRVTGTLIRESDDALTMRLDGRSGEVRIPRAVVGRVEVSVRRPSRALHGLAGAAIGAGVMGALFALAGGHSTPAQPDFSECEGQDVPGLCQVIVAAGAELGGMSPAVAEGVVLGGLIGGIAAAAEAHERWRPVEHVKVGLSLAPARGGVAVRLAVRF